MNTNAYALLTRALCYSERFFFLYRIRIFIQLTTVRISGLYERAYTQKSSHKCSTIYYIQIHNTCVAVKY